MRRLVTHLHECSAFYKYSYPAYFNTKISQATPAKGVDKLTADHLLSGPSGPNAHSLILISVAEHLLQSLFLLWPHPQGVAKISSNPPSPNTSPYPRLQPQQVLPVNTPAEQARKTGLKTKDFHYSLYSKHIPPFSSLAQKQNTCLLKPPTPLSPI